MSIASPGKLIVLGVVAVGCMTIIGIGMLTGADTTAAWATLASIIGYLVGNGAGARRGIPQAPVFEPGDELRSGGDEHLSDDVGA